MLNSDMTTAQPGGEVNHIRPVSVLERGEHNGKEHTKYY
jgi:hypothetical protein